MASFHVHADQENQNSNISRLKENRNRTSHVTQKRSVLGILDSNTSRANSRTLKNIKSVENNVQKQNYKSTFTVHEDKISEEKQVIKTECELEPKVKQEEETNEGLLHALSVVPRLPLKDLKVPCISHQIEEDDHMSQCEIADTDIGSPMSIEKSVHKSPKVRETNKNVSELYNCDEYERDIFKYLRETETRNRPKPFYMRRQPDITNSMRVILVNWLIEVQEEYKMKTETLYIAVSFIDRFLSLMSVVSGKLQLLGTSAMFIAAKYEEIYPPEVHEFVYITDDTYKKKQVLRMEHLILKVLGFNLSAPTVNTFLSHIAVSCDLSEKVYHLAMYLCELTLLEGDPFLQYLPSVVASSAIAVARHCLDYSEIWPEHMVDMTGYSLIDLVSCINEINKTHARVPDLPEKAVCAKYCKPRWHCVSEIESKPFLLDILDLSIYNQN